ncbi:MAG: hypothetical protein MdMp014T_1484 [Treponematales bacterium]
MASRLIFIALDHEVGVSIQKIEFEYSYGFAVSQKQRSILSLHESARRQGYNHILEISMKSLDELGVSLSAFNLSAKTKKKGYEFTVERAFQSSKVFEHGGPYIDLMAKISGEAKKDVRLKTSGLLLRFEFCGKEFPRNPPTFSMIGCTLTRCSKIRP